jgi:hypothetical protein
VLLLLLSQPHPELADLLLLCCKLTVQLLRVLLMLLQQQTQGDIE